MIGTTVRHFQIQQLAGEGAMGVVYKALDLSLDRPVALKLLRPYVSAGPDARRRFLQEARAAGRLSHPHITVVHEAFEHEGKLVIVSEWIDGPTLEGMAFKPPDLWPELLSVLDQIASALDAAHRAGVVHRDLKPANIMRTTSGSIKLCDFGIAHLLGSQSTTTGLVGTPNRIAPEIWRGEKIDGRADIFAFAVLAYELLTGKLPFPGLEVPVLFNQIVQEPRPAASLANLDLPEEIDQVFDRGLAKNPSRRFASAAEFVTRLRALLRPRDPATEARWSLRPPAVKKGRLLFVGISIVLLSVVSLGLVSQSPEKLAIIHFLCDERLWNLEAPSDHFTREISRQVAEVSSLEVVSRLRLDEQRAHARTPEVPGDASAFARDVAARVGAKWLLHGWVERVDSSLLISSELCDVGSGRVLCYPRTTSGTAEPPDSLIHRFAKEVSRLLDSLRSRRAAETPQM